MAGGKGKKTKEKEQDGEAGDNTQGQKGTQPNLGKELTAENGNGIDKNGKGGEHSTQESEDTNVSSELSPSSKESEGQSESESEYKVY